MDIFQGPHFPSFLKKCLFIIYFWLHWVFITVCRFCVVVGSLGYSLVAELSLLTAKASLVAGHRLSTMTYGPS